MTQPSYAERTLPILRRNAELYRKVLLDVYRRLWNAYQGDPLAVRKGLHAAFPDDEKVVDEFLANTTHNNEHEVEISSKVITSDVRKLAVLVEKLGNKSLANRLRLLEGY